jgi:hypothetical protein
MKVDNTNPLSAQTHTQFPAGIPRRNSPKTERHFRPYSVASDFIVVPDIFHYLMPGGLEQLFFSLHYRILTSGLLISIVNEE